MILMIVRMMMKLRVIVTVTTVEMVMVMVAVKGCVFPLFRLEHCMFTVLCYCQDLVIIKLCACVYIRSFYFTHTHTHVM